MLWSIKFFENIFFFYWISVGFMFRHKSKLVYIFLVCLGEDLACELQLNYLDKNLQSQAGEQKCFNTIFTIFVIKVDIIRGKGIFLIFFIEKQIFLCCIQQQERKEQARQKNRQKDWHIDNQTKQFNVNTNFDWLSDWVIYPNSIVGGGGLKSEKCPWVRPLITLQTNIRVWYCLSHEKYPPKVSIQNKRKFNLCLIRRSKQRRPPPHTIYEYFTPTILR